MDELVLLELLDEEEEAGAARRGPVPRADAVTTLSHAQFKNMFRISKDLFDFVLDLLTPYMRAPHRPTDLEIPIRILTALRFFASGSYQLDIGSNLFMAVSQPTVSRCITEVSGALNNPAIFSRFVKFPRNIEELDAVRLKFFQKYDFPGIVGCIDCTHVNIATPPLEDPERPAQIYMNRKGHHSLNVQLIVDPDLKIMNVNASHPGSSHDAFIWNNSNVQQVMRDVYAARRGTYYLLGDSGYPLRPWIMTPVPGEPAVNSPEYRYNRAQRSIRSVIERCNGDLKNRFRCLIRHRILHYAPQKAGQIVNACVVLHNICIENNIPDYNEPDEEVVNDGLFDPGDHEVVAAAGNNVDPELVEGRRVRNALIAARFSNR